MLQTGIPSADYPLVRRLLLPLLVLLLAVTALPGSLQLPSLSSGGDAVLTESTRARLPLTQQVAQAAPLRRPDAPRPVVAVTAPAPPPVVAVERRDDPPPVPEAPPVVVPPPATTPVTTPVPPPPVVVPPEPVDYGPVDGVVRARGGQLVLNGAPYTFTGINAYQLSTLWSVNTGCGQQVMDVDGVFAPLQPDSMVRVWAFQALATHRTTGLRDWTALDRVVRAAEAHGQRLVLVMSNQSGTCDDGHWHDKAWYEGGYKTVHPENRVLPASFAQYVDELVTRYRDSPALGMWELVNEPEAANCINGATGGGCYKSKVCPAGASAALRSFFDTMGARVHALDGRHLLAAGTIGGGQCGFTGTGWNYVHGSPQLDVLTYHDYGRDEEAWPAGVAQRLAESRALGKPFVIEEVGVRAGSAAGCATTADRFRLLDRKQTAAMTQGASGWMLWNHGRNDGSSCTYDLDLDEPALGLVRA